MVAGELPGDPEVEKPFSLEGVFEWLRDCPHQVRRVTVTNGAENSSPFAIREVRNANRNIKPSLLKEQL
jgi:hypothetical protein